MDGYISFCLQTFRCYRNTLRLPSSKNDQITDVHYSSKATPDRINLANLILLVIHSVISDNSWNIGSTHNRIKPLPSFPPWSYLQVFFDPQLNCINQLAIISVNGSIYCIAPDCNFLQKWSIPSHVTAYHCVPCHLRSGPCTALVSQVQ